MEPTVIVALISFAGTLLGTAAGVLTSTKMTTYRIQQLEKRVEQHNEVVVRTYVLEGQVKELQHEMVDLKNKTEV